MRSALSLLAPILMPTMPSPRRACRLARRRLHAAIVEAHAVDDGAILGQAEQARPRIAGLRPRRDGAAFDKTEAELAPSHRAPRRSCRSRPPARSDWGSPAPRRARPAAHRRAAGLGSSGATSAVSRTVARWAVSAGRRRRHPRRQIQIRIIPHVRPPIDMDLQPRFLIIGIITAKPD